MPLFRKSTLHGGQPVKDEILALDYRETRRSAAR
jgi:hypothetical protein